MERQGKEKGEKDFSLNYKLMLEFFFKFLYVLMVPIWLSRN